MRSLTPTVHSLHASEVLKWEDQKQFSQQSFCFVSPSICTALISKSHSKGISKHHSLRGLDMLMQCIQPTHAIGSARGHNLCCSPACPTLLIGLLAEACVGIMVSTGGILEEKGTCLFQGHLPDFQLCVTELNQERRWLPWGCALGNNCLASMAPHRYFFFSICGLNYPFANGWSHG